MWKIVLSLPMYAMCLYYLHYFKIFFNYFPSPKKSGRLSMSLHSLFAYENFSRTHFEK